MNCKPGDLAVIVGHDDESDTCTLGLLIRVTKLDPDWWEPVWEYEGRPLTDDEGARLLAISDRYLRPIRPGDVSDEEVRHLYAPKLPEVA